MSKRVVFRVLDGRGRVARSLWRTSYGFRVYVGGRATFLDVREARQFAEAILATLRTPDRQAVERPENFA